MFGKFFSRSLMLAGIATVAAATGFAALTTGGATVASAAPAAVDLPCPWANAICGRPAGFDAGDANGWYVWNDDDGFHIRTTTPADRAHPFTAVITTDGRFADVSKVRLEGADDIRILDGGHRLVVRFHTWDGVDGVDFKTTGDDLRFRLEEYGLLVPDGRIFLGHFELHPGNNPFTIHRQP